MKHYEILKIYQQKLKWYNYGERTIEIYSHYCNKFLLSIDKYHQHLNSDDFSNYLSNYKYTSISQQNQIINAVKFLYEKVLDRKYGKVCFERPRKEKYLPQIIDKDLIIKELNTMQNKKHKSIIMLAFSVGLRVSEVINLKIEDIDSKRMIINIRQAKGRKDRVVPLSGTVLNTLREYFKEYKPKQYLFNGQFDLKYSAGSCNQIVKQHLGEKYHFHLLRHSSFTSMLESGVDLRIIQKIAGHANSKTTEIYTHVSNQLLSRVALPIKFYLLVNRFIYQLNGK